MDCVLTAFRIQKLVLTPRTLNIDQLGLAPWAPLGVVCNLAASGLGNGSGYGKFLIATHSNLKYDSALLLCIMLCILHFYL